MTGRRYLVYDVFTDARLAGNPLAVVLDCAGLDDIAMQAIAREFNLSETVFVSPPAMPSHTAAVRIFTPAYELPFAGHPTIGTAIALSELDDANGATDTRLIVLEERIGDVRCAINLGGNVAFAEFDLPLLPKVLESELDGEAIAAALGLAPHEIGFENHRPALYSAGVPYVIVPIAGMDAIANVRFDNNAWVELAPRREDGNPACAYLYCRETIVNDSGFHARMFVPGPPFEDPATGSAAAAFAGAILHFDQLPDGSHRIWIEQGHEMGRPSRIRLELDVVAGGLKSARIGGSAVKVATGSITV